MLTSQNCTALNNSFIKSFIECSVLVPTYIKYLLLAHTFNEFFFILILWVNAVLVIYLGRFIRKSAKTNKKKQGWEEYERKKIMR